MRDALLSPTKNARTILTLLAALTVFAACTITVYAKVANRGPQISLSASKSTKTVLVSGGGTRYHLKVGRRDYRGPVKVRVTGKLPAGVSATFVDARGRRLAAVPVPGARLRAYGHRAQWYLVRSGQRRVNVVVATTSGALGAGDWKLRVRAAALGAVARTSKTLHILIPSTVSGAGSQPVAAQSSSPFTMTTASAERTVASGDAGTFPFVVAGGAGNGNSAVRYELDGTLPDGAAAAFSQNPSPNGNATLTITTDNARTPDGTYTFTVRATRGNATVTVTITLVVATPPGAPLPITGSITDLSPGVTKPLNLSLRNDNSFPLTVSALSVSMDNITGPNITSALPCTVTGTTVDYTLTPFSGTLPLTLPPGTHTLSELGVPAAQRPQITMLNRDANQDGCKGSSIALTYAGAARRTVEP